MVWILSGCTVWYQIKGQSRSKNEVWQLVCRLQKTVWWAKDVLTDILTHSLDCSMCQLYFSAAFWFLIHSSTSKTTAVMWIHNLGQCFSISRILNCGSFIFLLKVPSAISDGIADPIMLNIWNSARYPRNIYSTTMIIKIHYQIIFHIPMLKSFVHKELLLFQMLIYFKSTPLDIGQTATYRYHDM